MSGNGRGKQHRGGGPGHISFKNAKTTAPQRKTKAQKAKTVAMGKAEAQKQADADRARRRKNPTAHLYDPV